MIQTAAITDHDAIIRVWELSVRATHDFLPEDYLQEIKALLPAILPQVTQLYVWKTADGHVLGFAGVAEEKIEMLFIHPDHRGQGIGRRLTDFCVQELKAGKVDVNEQNAQAVAFYMKMGFVQTGYQPKDGLGRDFPILSLVLRR